VKREDGVKYEGASWLSGGRVNVGKVRAMLAQGGVGDSNRRTIGGTGKANCPKRKNAAYQGF